MKRYLLLFWLLPFVLFADFDHLFPHDDPTSVHHVNVISGHLHLSWEDIVVQGAVPLPLSRSYSSSGALIRDMDGFVQSIRRGWMPLGGWSFLPHTNLMVELLPLAFGRSRIYIPERSGGTILYGYTKYLSKTSCIFSPAHKIARASGYLSARTQPHNNRLLFHLDSKGQGLSTPDGGRKNYVGPNLKKDKFDKANRFRRPYFYRLDHEILPSGHMIFYKYANERDHDLIRIELVNPKATKVFASIDLEPKREGPVLKNLALKTSDGKSLNYSTVCFDHSYYFNHLNHSP